MNTDFECVECKHRFNADKDKFVNCPNCGSDNVKLISKSNLKYVLFTAIFIVAAIAGFFITYHPDKNPVENLDEYEDITLTPESSFSIEEKQDKEELYFDKEEEFEKEIPEYKAPAMNVNLEIEVYELEYSKESKTYSFKTKCNNAPEGIALSWSLTTNDNMVVAQSKTGEFAGIAPLENDAMYILTALGKNEQYECNGSIYVQDCKVVKEEAQIVRLTVADVQASLDDEKMLDKYKRSGQILNRLKIKVLDWGGYEETQYGTLDDLIIAATMESFSIRVVDVGHNTTGVVNYIEVTLE